MIDESTRALLAAHRDVRELLVPAVLDMDVAGPLVLPDPHTVYLGRPGAYLRFQITPGSGQLVLGSAATPEAELVEDPEEPDMKAAVLDLTCFHLGNGQPLRIAEAVLYQNAASDPAARLFRAVLIRFGTGKTLLLDPHWVEGFNVGRECELDWLRRDGRPVWGEAVTLP